MTVKGPGIPCPHCGNASRVIDTRPDQIAGGLRRRRRCLCCRARFSTTEGVLDLDVTSGSSARTAAALMAQRYLALDDRGRKAVASLMGVLEDATRSTDTKRIPDDAPVAAHH
jgi:hypothetical protein